MRNPAYQIEEPVIPEEPGAEGWADFARAAEVHNTVEADAYGTDELSVSAAEALPDWLNQDWEPRRLFVVRVTDDGAIRSGEETGIDAGRIVARGVYEWPKAGPETAWLRVDVLPGYRNRGIGGALFDVLEAISAADGGTNQIVYAASADSPGERLLAPTGFGSVPLGNPEVRFLLKRGYRLEQVERGSRLALPVDQAHIDRLLTSAEEHAAREYDVVQWVGPTPAHWRTDLAWLYEKMSTDAPTAGLEEPEDLWSPERLLDTEALLEDGPRTVLTSAVVHRRSGRLVGFTELSVPGEPYRPVHQEDTLVLREHRGHRLGMLLKASNLENLRLTAPGHPSVITFNAEENRHMLAINEALGFVPFGYEGGWRRRTPESSGP
jgi:GNAT superfamily N-acetyltransferase